MANTLPSSSQSLAKEITALFGPSGGVDLNSEGAVIPTRLSAGDKVRFVSPASSPDKDQVVRAANILESWGLSVDFGQHAFDRFDFFAGSDEDRLADLNAAFRDPAIRAIFATRGGKGSYRLADRLDFGAIRQDPKWIIGFSDITSLHLSFWSFCRQASVHGAVTDVFESNEALRALLERDDFRPDHTRHFQNNFCIRRV
jgi:muramoyltetrapeptide carboxypeptidase